MKKVIKICSAVVAVAAITGIGYWSNASRSSDVNLSELVEISDADAECSTNTGLLTGHCLVLLQHCAFGSGSFDSYSCNPYYLSPTEL
ncbi:MAG: hypothetical protein HDS39_07145 [Bacteroides sp.]|nr:hypothetical protein [Bacteroides sp.]